MDGRRILRTHRPDGLRSQPTADEPDKTKRRRTMADINVKKRSDEQGRGLERRPAGSGFLRRHDFGLSNDVFSMSPFTLMRRLTDDMDRMFSGWGGQGLLEASNNWIPPVEVRESNGTLAVFAELPGLNKEDV